MSAEPECTCTIERFGRYNFEFWVTDPNCPQHGYDYARIFDPIANAHAAINYYLKATNRAYRLRSAEVEE